MKKPILELSHRPLDVNKNSSISAGNSQLSLSTNILLDTKTIAYR